MNYALKEKYYVKFNNTEGYADFTDPTFRSGVFDGVRILKIEGLNEKGEAQNVYMEQWIGEQEEDFGIAANSSGTQSVIFKNVDIKITFVISQKYATNTIDLHEAHENFVTLMRSNVLYIKSLYSNKEVRCFAKESYKPTLEKYNRGMDSFVMGTITFHTLDMPTSVGEVVTGDVYIGFGGATLTSVSDISSLTSVQHYEKDNPSGTYTIVCSSTSYLWICSTSQITNSVKSDGFEIPMESATIVGDYYCYRTSNAIIAHTMSFTIE